VLTGVDDGAGILNALCCGSLEEGNGGASKDAPTLWEEARDDAEEEDPVIEEARVLLKEFGGAYGMVCQVSGGLVAVLGIQTVAG